MMHACAFKTEFLCHSWNTDDLEFGDGLWPGTKKDCQSSVVDNPALSPGIPFAGLIDQQGGCMRPHKTLSIETGLKSQAVLRSDSNPHSVIENTHPMS